MILAAIIVFIGLCAVAYSISKLADAVVSAAELMDDTLSYHLSQEAQPDGQTSGEYET